jgi:hypothetical protein
MNHIYNLEIFISKCIVEIQMNGLLLMRADAKLGTSLTYPLNTELTDENNLTLVMYPVLLETGLPSVPTDINIEGGIKRYGVGEYTGPEFGELLVHLNAEELQARYSSDMYSLQDLAAAFPLKLSYAFESEGVSFKKRLLEADKITDKNKVLQYAVTIRDLLAKQDLNGLYREYEPKLDDYAIAYPGELPDKRAWFDNFMKNDFFPGGPVTGFAPDDIEARPWCDGRIWEVFIKPYTPFFTNAGLDGSINSIEMFVGVVDGKLKIVR